MVLKVNCLSTWLLGPGKGFVIYLGKTLPFHGLEALMFFIMAMLMSIIFRAPCSPQVIKIAVAIVGVVTPIAAVVPAGIEQRLE